MKECADCEHYPDCKADPDCGELKVCEFWSNSPAEADPVLLAERGRPSNDEPLPKNNIHHCPYCGKQISVKEAK